MFADEDFRRLSTADESVYLFAPGCEPDEASLRYIRQGERLGYNERFITRHRKPWYKTEVRQVAPLLLNVFSRSGYKVVRNYSSALTLTNFHCFYPHRMREQYVGWLFLYLKSRIGRQILSLSKRKYGNALDKFEPNDLNSALVPKSAFFDSLGKGRLEELMRMVQAGEDVDDQLDAVFSPLLSSEDELPGEDFSARNFVGRSRPRTAQMLLAVGRGKAKPTTDKKNRRMK